jgi:hypothetical protein
VLIGALSSEQRLFLISFSLFLCIAARSLTVPPVDSITVFLLKQLGCWLALQHSLGAVSGFSLPAHSLTHSKGAAYSSRNNADEFLSRPPTGRRTASPNFCLSRAHAHSIHSQQPARVHIYIYVYNMNFNCKNTHFKRRAFLICVFLKMQCLSYGRIARHFWESPNFSMLNVLSTYYRVGKLRRFTFSKSVISKCMNRDEISLK